MIVPSPSSRSRNRIIVSSWDLVWATASPPLALFVRDGAAPFHGDWAVAVYYCLFASAFALMSFFALRIQDGLLRNFSVQEFLSILEAVLFTELMTCGVLFSLTRMDGIPRSMPLIHAALLGAGLIGGRLFFRVILPDSAHEHQTKRERIVVIGASRFAFHFIQMLRAYAPPSHPVIAVLDQNPKMVGRAVADVQVMGMPHELDAIVTEFAIHGIHVDRVVVAGEASQLGEATSLEIERVCQERQILLQYLPRLVGITESREPELATASEHAQRPLSSYFWLKRWIDVLGAFALMVILSPVAVIAGFLVLLDVGAPVLFWQERLRWEGGPFLIYKFRTLRAPFDADGERLEASREPSAIGRFLRATRLDELPQLLNVLLGDMSLIGPRPLLPEDQPGNLADRLSVRPGLTGWAQVNGGKLVSKEEKEAFDTWYVRNASLRVDIYIALLTLKIVMTNQYAGQEATADTEQVRQKGVDILTSAQRKIAS
ncbi:sugar transferase [Bradyrhizobium guangxiense]|uniref:sugar transferase n=1 Tax=Bradyrhizobium guangxiense TaxID=1325115 RepID=UPI00100871E6|nr:sugar transferase [Bradyrhizobium guangxiense]